MEYKIRNFYCLWNMYLIIQDKIFYFLDNEILGKILAYFFYYVISIVGFIPILVVTIYKTVSDIKLGKKVLKENNIQFIEIALKNKLIKQAKKEGNDEWLCKHNYIDKNLVRWE